MHQIIQFFENLFNSDSWPARWHCGVWTPFHGWLYIVSSILIALAYFSIPLSLLYIIKRSKGQLPFRKIFWLFILFILFCGLTHVFDALMFWYPLYRLSAVMLFITAIVSLMAVYSLFKIIPAVLKLKSPEMLEKIIQERTLQLEEANNCLQKTNEQLQASQLATEKLMQQKEEFLSIASHELKTPVTVLKAYAQLLSEKPYSDGQGLETVKEKMQNQVNKLAVLIYDLLDVTKIREGMLLYNKRLVNLAGTVRTVAEEMITALGSGHQIFVETDDAKVFADEERIAQVITNLISNAIKYSPVGSSINLILKKENNRVIFSVQDFGLGIPENEKDKVFEKYYRLSANRLHNYPGMGLGLHIAKTIIENHDGAIWVESKEHKGSTFYFSLPAAE